VDLRLRSEPPARVADLACGTGWSSIAMAQAYPLISVDGFDLDADAIAAARRHAGRPAWRTVSRSPPLTRPAPVCPASTTW